MQSIARHWWIRAAAVAAGVVAALLVAVFPSAAAAATATIAGGETLSHVAARHGVGVADLAAANGISNPDRVVAGTRLEIPAPGASSGPQTAPAQPGSGVHRVAPGETLSGIAARYGTTAGALARANGRSVNAILGVGVRLSVPGSASSGSAASAPATTSGGGHRVASGETLSSIAARYGVGVAELARANGLADPDLVVTGQTLSIPRGPGGTHDAPTTSGPPASSGSVASLLDQASARHGVPADLARAVAWQESGWQQSARSSVGAIGVMQLMPATADWFGPAVLGRPVNPHSVADNVDAGVAYLSYLTRQLGDQRLAVGAYYRGPNAVRRYGLGTETQAYVSDVMALRGNV